MTLLILQDLQKEIHAQACKSGFWRTCDDPECEAECCPDVREDDLSKPCISDKCTKPANIPEKLCLMHSELSEALEEYRSNPHAAHIYFTYEGVNYPISVCKAGTYGTSKFLEGMEKPLGIGIELADCVIRILDFCQAYDIDLAEAIELKMKYNATRPYKHGKVC